MKSQSEPHPIKKTKPHSSVIPTIRARMSQHHENSSLFYETQTTRTLLMIDCAEHNQISQPSLFEEGKLLVLPKKGVFALCEKTSSNKMTSAFYPLEHLEFALKNVDIYKDIYLSQCLFGKNRRRAIDMIWNTHAFVDLDIYKTKFAYMKQDQIVFMLLYYCREEGIPCPSYIICSGRGYYLKWAWSEPVSRCEAGRLVEINRALVECFKAYGADPQCVSMSQLLRVPETYNHRENSITKAELVWTSVQNGMIITYDFGDFVDELTTQNLGDLKGDITSERIKSFDKQRKMNEQASNSAGWFMGYTDYNWRRFEDFRNLLNMRHGDKAPETQRHKFAFPMTCSVVASTPKCQSWYEIYSLLSDMFCKNWLKAEFKASGSAILERARRSNRGEFVEWAGGMQTPAYKLRTTTIIQRFEIEPYEIEQMQVLIDKREKHRRRIEKTRADGVQPRAEYLAKAERKRERIKDLGISHRTYLRRIKAGTLEP